MALKTLQFQPGINRDKTNYSDQGGWFDGDMIRFRQGYPEKIGGWQVENFAAYEGTARSLYAYATSDGAINIGIGTNSKMYIAAGSYLHDITPIRATFVSSATDNCFTTTTSAATTVTVNIVGHGALAGDFVTFSGATAVGGILAANLNLEFEIQTIVDADNFTITTATSATSGATGGGTGITAVFQLNIGSATTSGGLGFGTGTFGRGTFGSSIVAPVLVFSQLTFQDNFNNDLIFNISEGDIFHWTYENTYGNRAVKLNTLSGSRAVPEQVTKIFFAPSGHLLALGCTSFNPTTTAGAGISSITRGGTGNTTATLTTSGAHGLATLDYVTVSGTIPTLFSLTSQITVTGATTFTYTMLADPGGNATTVGSYVKNSYGGSLDPLLVRWANVDPTIGPEPEVWEPTATNTAGFLPIKSGSEIVTGINARQETLIWTNTALTSLQFLGTREVFGIQEISNEISIMGPNVVATSNNNVFWMGNDKFYVYSGRVDTLPCTLKQFVFEDISRDKSDTFFAGTNSEFNEIIWFYVSGSSNEIDRYVIFNQEEKIWYYGSLVRTAWIDSGVNDFPLATDSGNLYSHENGNDDGQRAPAVPVAITSFVQSADMAVGDGEEFILTKRVLPDVNFIDSDVTDSTGAALTPQVEMTVGVRNFPGAASSTTDVAGASLERNVTTATATIDQYTDQVFLRARGRQMNFKIGSTGVGVQWQLGSPRVDFKPDGRRG